MFCSGQSSIFVGSPSNPVLYTRVVLLDPTVINLVPSGVYDRYVGPLVWAGLPRMRACVVVAMVSCSMGRFGDVVVQLDK